MGGLAFVPTSNAMSQDMRRFVPLLIAGAVLIAAACSDPIAPSRSTSVAQMVTGSATPTSISDDNWSGTFTFALSPSGGSVKIGGFRLDYDANAVCDPATSGYGPEYWLADCTTLAAPLTMTAKITIVDGRTSIDFSPDIRFRPSAVVNLGVKRKDVYLAPLTDELSRSYSILYFRDVNGVRQYFDESASDSDMGTHVEPSQGRVWRRIRHFSGYYVRSGDRCDEALDPTCGGGLY